MCSYDVALAPIADLTDVDMLATLGVSIADLAGRWLDVPDAPGQRLSERLIAEGWSGALYRSAQRPEGTNLIVWTWTDMPPRKVSLVDRLSEAPTKPLVG